MERFDTKAKEWDNNPYIVKRAKTFAKEINNFIQPNKTLNALEFGCGTGLLSFELKDTLNTIFGAEASKGMIEVLKENIEKKYEQNIKIFPLFLIIIKKYRIVKTF